MIVPRHVAGSPILSSMSISLPATTNVHGAVYPDLVQATAAPIGLEMIENAYDYYALRAMMLVCASCWAVIVAVWLWMTMDLDVGEDE